MAYQFRLSLCNEAYSGWAFDKVCRHIRETGFEGIEIAPFTLAEDPAGIPPSRRCEYRDIIRSEGLEFVGLHWLLAAPKGLHVTTPDAALRERSWRHVHDLIDLCADLAGDREQCGVMVFGSPQQRRTTDGATRVEATARFAEGLASVAGHAGDRRVRVLAEALPAGQCDVLLTLAEAVEIVRQINHPAIRTMFDTHNAVDETEPHPVLVDRYFDFIEHVHVNEIDGRHPGAGDYDFAAVFDVLARREFAGWVSAEPFDFSPGPEKIAAETIQHLKAQIEKLNL